VAAFGGQGWGRVSGAGGATKRPPWWPAAWIPDGKPTGGASTGWRWRMLVVRPAGWGMLAKSFLNLLVLLTGYLFNLAIELPGANCS